MNVEAFVPAESSLSRSRGKNEREGDEEEPGGKASFSIPMALTG